MALLVLSLLIGLAGVWAPAVQAALLKDALEQAREKAQAGQSDGPRSDNDKPRQIIIKPCCEWDRTGRLPAPVLVSRQPTPLAARPGRGHLAGRFEIVKHILLGDSIFRIAGPFRNHAPHGPPTARV